MFAGFLSRILFIVRTPYAAFLRQGACRVYSQRLYNRLEQDCTCRRGVLASSAGSGEAYIADKGVHTKDAQPAWRDGSR